MDITQFVRANGIKGAVFDMDGTLTPSMSRWEQIYKILFDSLDLTSPREFIMRVNHLPMKNRVEIIIKEFSLDADVRKVYSRWVAGAIKFYEEEFKIKPYMLEALVSLNSLGVKSAIATASDRLLAEAFVRSNNLEGYVSSIIGLDEVKRSKNFPDVYLKAAQKLCVQPQACIVFEDALTALNAAKKGGFKICGVQDECSVREKDNIIKISDITLGF